MNDRQWVRYSEARTNAGAFAVLAVLTVPFGARVVSTSFTEWSATYLLALVIFSGASFGLFLLAEHEWDRAKHVKLMARVEGIAATTYTVILATAVLKALTEVADGCSPGGDEA